MGATVERLAKAMREAYAVHTGEGCCAWSRAKAGPRKAWIVCARAALQELRAPDKPMLSGISDELAFGQRCDTVHRAEPVWEAAIDAALAEPA